MVTVVNASAVRAAGHELGADPDRIVALQRCAVLAPLPVLTSGDCFGEIAALNAIARTVSVVADTECRLLALDGPISVRAVSTHRVAMDAAVELSGNRLNSTA